MQTRKLTIAALFIAIGILTAHMIYIPAGVSRCFPVQHAINVNNDKSLPIEILRSDFIVADFAMLRLYQYGMLTHAFKTNFDYTNYRVGY